jgi:hypothetical protein
MTPQVHARNRQDQPRYTARQSSGPPGGLAAAAITRGSEHCVVPRRLPNAVASRTLLSCAMPRSFACATRCITGHASPPSTIQSAATRCAALRERGHSHGRALRVVADRLLGLACVLRQRQTMIDPHLGKPTAQMEILFDGGQCLFRSQFGLSAVSPSRPAIDIRAARSGGQAPAGPTPPPDRSDRPAPPRPSGAGCRAG